MRTAAKRFSREEAGLAKSEYAFFASLLVVMVIVVYVVGRMMITDAVNDGTQRVINEIQSQKIDALEKKVEGGADKGAQEDMSP
ncbi:MAG TPA: hypothetical protein VKA55_07595 [Gammaproteobacteria bacterium]|nr:hypothetical protein [Gammaproteobacteria bacterium]